jgi:hypothetical protein
LPKFDRTLIFALADKGFHFAPCTSGMTRSNMFEWETKCSKNKTQIGEWLDEGYSLVLVSVRDQGFSLDIDDWEACIAKGFKPEWVEGYPGSDTPSGGKHCYCEPSPEQTHDLAKTVNVYNERDDNKSGLILELKIEAASVAAPGARRFDQPRKVDGVYRPFNCGPYVGKAGIHPDLLEWIKTNCYRGKSEEKEYSRCTIKWHSTWDEDVRFDLFICQRFAAEIRTNCSLVENDRPVWVSMRPL